MSNVSVNRLADMLRTLGLVEGDRQELLRHLAEPCATPRELTRELVRQEWLTAFQANELLNGRGSRLRVGPYLLAERCCAGGGREVYRASRRSRGSVVSLEILPPERAAALEARVSDAARLCHPHLAAVWAAGVADGTGYLVREWIEGIDLARLVERLGPLPAPLACRLIRQAACGLQLAHQLGFCHGELTAAALLVCPPGDMPLSPERTPDELLAATTRVLDVGLSGQTNPRADLRALGDCLRLALCGAGQPLPAPVPPALAALLDCLAGEEPLSAAEVVTTLNDLAALGPEEALSAPSADALFRTAGPPLPHPVRRRAVRGRLGSNWWWLSGSMAGVAADFCLFLR